MTEEPRVQARIVQICPLPVGWGYDEYNRAIGIALVSITYRDGTEASETFFLGEDATLVGADDDVYYSAHAFGDWDGRKFAHYHGPDWEPSR